MTRSNEIAALASSQLEGDCLGDPGVRSGIVEKMMGWIQLQVMSCTALHCTAVCTCAVSPEATEELPFLLSQASAAFFALSFSFFLFLFFLVVCFGFFSPFFLISAHPRHIRISK